MNHKLTILYIVFFLGLGLTELYSQEALLPTGGNASGSGGSASYSIGQVDYITITGSNGSVAQGVQQPFEISDISGLEEAKGITLQCEAYPNPATDFLKLEIDASTFLLTQHGTTLSIQSLSYQLFDINGKLLETKKLESNETIIVMKQLVPATYFLKVIQTMNASSSREIKTFKIIKN